MNFYDSLSNRRVAACALLLTAGALGGCSMTPTQNTAPVTSIKFGGFVKGGQQPVASATVQVWAVGHAGYGSAATLLTTVTSAADGSFGIPNGSYTCPQANTPTYITARGGDPGGGSTNAAIMLAAPLGACSDAPTGSIDMNEVTTVATALAYAQFFPALNGSAASDSIGSPSTGSGTIVYPVGLLNAFTTANTLASMNAGTAPGNVETATVEVAKINHLANILAACINTSSPGSAQCSTLFSATTPSSGIAPTDTLQAAVSIATHPSAGVAALFGLSAASSPFQPSLTAAPTDWTVAVNYPLPGKAASYNMAADSQGNVWFATVAPTALYEITPGGTINGPYLSGLMDHPTGVAIDTNNNVYITDDITQRLLEYTNSGVETTLFSGGPALSSPIFDGSNNLYLLANNGPAPLLTQYLAAPGTNLNGLLNNLPIHNATSIAVDPSGDFFVTAYTNRFEVGYKETPYTVTSSHGTVIGGYNESQVETSVATSSSWSSALDHNLNLFSPAASDNAISTSEGVSYIGGGLNLPAAVALDGAGMIWASNAGTNSNGMYSVSQLTNGGAPVSPSTGYQHVGMGTPAGITLDGSGNVWVANTSVPMLTEIVGAARPVVTPLATALANNAIGVTP